MKDFIAELRELEAKSTPGPWKLCEMYDNGRDMFLGIVSEKIAAIDPIMEDIDDCLLKPDAELIVIMRNVWPEMIAVVEAAKVLVSKGPNSEDLADDFFEMVETVEALEARVGES